MTPAVLRVQSLPAVRHDEVASEDDLVTLPVGILNGLDLKPEALQPGGCMILAAAELAGRQGAALIPLVRYPGDGLRVVLPPLVHEEIRTGLAEVVRL